MAIHVEILKKTIASIVNKAHWYRAQTDRFFHVAEIIKLAYSAS